MAWFKSLTLGKKFLIIFLALIYIFVWSLAGFLVGKKFVVAKEEKPVIGSLLKEGVVPEIADVPNPINGVFYTKKEAENWKNRVPIAVMVENSTMARPHSGLSKADIIYEALAEGAATRFVVVFLSNSSKVGPVRSAREYYMDWALEYKAAYAHWGGNIGVRALASQLFGKKNLDQFEIPKYFFRDPPGGGEHSGYTTTDNMWEAATARGVNSPVSFDSWLFKDEQKSAAPNATEINVPFTGGAGYTVQWRYDPATNTYLRWNGGAPFKDKLTNEQIRVKTVIVCYLQDLGMKIVTGVGNRNFVTTGENVVKIFQDGAVIEGVWKKVSREGRTKFYKDGKEISLNRGQIWMEMVQEGSAVSWK